MQVVRFTTTFGTLNVTERGICAGSMPNSRSFCVGMLTRGKVVHSCGEPRSVVNHECARGQLSTGQANPLPSGAGECMILVSVAP